MRIRAPDRTIRITAPDRTMGITARDRTMGVTARDRTMGRAACVFLALCGLHFLSPVLYPAFLAYASQDIAWTESAAGPDSGNPGGAEPDSGYSGGVEPDDGYSGGAEPDSGSADYEEALKLIFGENPSPEQEEIKEQLKQQLEKGGFLDGTGTEESGAVSVSPEPVLLDGEGRFVCALPNGSALTTSIPHGMTSTKPVTVLPMENAHVTVWQDGGRLETPEDGVYSEPGSYHVEIIAMPQSGTGGDNRLYRVDFRFRIIPETVSGLNLLKAPEGFVFDRLTRDGEDVPPDHPAYHFLQEDGRYEAWFRNEKNSLGCGVVFTRDTTAPLLKITPDIVERTMKEPVTLELDDPQIRAVMYYNGKQAPIALKRLEEGGFYRFYLTDLAGNERVYAVSMAERPRLPGPGAVIITVVLLAGLAGWFCYQRRHPRFL